MRGIGNSFLSNYSQSLNSEEIHIRTRDYMLLLTTQALSAGFARMVTTASTFTHLIYKTCRYRKMQYFYPFGAYTRNTKDIVSAND